MQAAFTGVILDIHVYWSWTRAVDTDIWNDIRVYNSSTARRAVPREQLTTLLQERYYASVNQLL